MRASKLYDIVTIPATSPPLVADTLIVMSTFNHGFVLGTYSVIGDEDKYEYAYVNTRNEKVEDVAHWNYFEKIAMKGNV